MPIVGIQDFIQLTASEVAWVQQGAGLTYAKGTILVADSSGDLQTLAVGANNLAIVADSGETLGLKYSSVATGSPADDIKLNGTINSSNTAFTLEHPSTPSPVASLILDYNGQIILADIDYTLTGTAVATLFVPTGGTMRGWYRY